LSTCTGPFFKALSMTESPLRLISVAGIVFRIVSFVVRMNLLYLNHPITASSNNLSLLPRLGDTTDLLPFPVPICRDLVGCEGDVLSGFLQP
jgi:hypothetical protein